MKKILLSISFVILLGCASSRKTNKENLEYTNKIESLNTVEKDGVKVSDISLNFQFDNTEYTFTPIDTSKPMKIGNKEFKNAVVKSKHQSERTEIKNKDSTALKTKENTKVLQNEKVVLKAKETDKKGQSFIFWYIVVTFVIVVLIYLFIFIKNKIKQKNPLN